MSSKIRSVHAREVFAQRGNLGLEVTVTTDTGAVGVSTPEAGVSTGAYEMAFVLDGGERYNGMGVRKAAQNVLDVAPQLVGIDVTRQREIDDLLIALDGTPNKSRLGANAIVGISIAVARAAANATGLPLYRYIAGLSPARGGQADTYILPMPIIGVGPGGRYRDPGTDRWFKPSYEFIAYDARNYSDSMEIIWRVNRRFQRLLQERYGYNVRAYHGSHLAGVLKDDREILDAMTQAIQDTGYEGKVGLYFDAAAGCYYEKDIDRYVGIFSPGEKDLQQMVATYKEFVANYPLLSIEDPLHEEDLEGHALLTRELGIEIVGDDLFTTNIARVRQAMAVGAANSMVLKVTQVGTVSEALDAAAECLRNGYNVHPCGSRGDQDTIADFAVGLNAGQIRAFDHNRLLTIEQELGDAALWPGKAFFKTGPAPLKTS